MHTYSVLTESSKAEYSQNEFDYECEEEQRQREGIEKLAGIQKALVGAFRHEQEDDANDKSGIKLIRRNSTVIITSYKTIAEVAAFYIHSRR